MNARDLDRQNADAPIFDSAAFRLADDEAALIGKARRIRRPCAGAARSPT